MKTVTNDIHTTHIFHNPYFYGSHFFPLHMTFDRGHLVTTVDTTN